MPSKPRSRGLVHRPRKWVWVLAPWLFLLLLCWIFTQPPSIAAYYRHNLYSSTLISLRRLVTYCREIIVPLAADVWNYVQNVLLPWMVRLCKATQEGFPPWILRQYYSFPDKLSALYAGSSVAIIQLESAWKTLSRTARRTFTLFSFSTTAYIQGLSGRREELSKVITILTHHPWVIPSVALAIGANVFRKLFKLINKPRRRVLNRKAFLQTVVIVELLFVLIWWSIDRGYPLQHRWGRLIEWLLPIVKRFEVWFWGWLSGKRSIL